MGRREQHQSVELEPALVQAYAAVFIPRFDCHPIQNQTEPNLGQYRTEYAPLTLDMVADHLQGRHTLGAYALDPDSQAKWLCFDADTYQEYGKLWRMAFALKEQ